jgi:mRNA interferase RelE/StbE
LTWKVEFDDRALKELRKLDPQIQRQILLFLRQRVATPDNPKRFGKPLSGDRLGLWRYRIGSYRLICRIEEDRVVVLVLGVGHRKDVYR